MTYNILGMKLRKRGLQLGLVFALFFMFIPAQGEKLYEAYQRQYYQNADIINFYENRGIIMADVCFQDTTQHVTTHRYANSTDTGWKAHAVKELFRNDGTTENPSWVNLSAHSVETGFFIEVDKNGVSTRETAFPLVDIGHYRWEITLDELYLPYGVIRYDVPTIITSSFFVKECINK